jgi:hypothetical protein
MTDPLDRLRAANPVSTCDPPDAQRLWRTIQDDAATALRADADAALESANGAAAVPAPSQPLPRRHRLPSPSRRARSSPGPRRAPAARLALGLAPLVGVAVILALLATLGGGAGPSVAARAYAATTPTGVIDHYVEISRARPAPGNPPFGYIDTRSEVWSSGTRTHVLSTDYVVSAHGHRSVRHGEQAINGRRATSLFGGNGIYTSILPPAGEVPIRTCLTVLVCDFEPADPITTMRALYRAGRLHDAGQTVQTGRLLDIITGSDRPTSSAPGTDVRILVDPHTFVPVEVATTSYGALGSDQTIRRLVTETTTITHYERIPLTPQTTELLAMRPHPGAQTLCAIGRPSPTSNATPVLAGC